MSSDSDEFFDAVSSLNEVEIESNKKSHDSEELKIIDLKSSIHSKNTLPFSYKTREILPTLKAASIPLKFKVLFMQNNKKQPEFNNVRLLQEIDLIDKQNFTRWVIRFSEDANYLSISGTGNQIFIYNMFKRSSNYLSTTPEKILNRHTEEVTCLSWSLNNKLLSSGRDNKVILWDPATDEPIDVFLHPSPVTACKFYNNNPDYFITACKDKLLRVFKVSEKKPLSYYQISMNCYSLDFDFNSSNLAVGTNKGEVLFYSVRPDCQLRLINKIVCKNRRGVYSKGKKVVGLKFISSEWLMVSTGDSRIRIMNYTQNVLVQKFKGLKNLNSKICPDYSLKHQTLISGSEDGKIYFWKNDPDTIKNNKYESFKPRQKKTAEYTIIAPQKIEDDIRSRFIDGELKFVLLSIGAKDLLKIFLVLSK